MGLKFMERDENILYIQDLIGQYKISFGTGVDSYKEGKKPAVVVVDIQKRATSLECIMGPKNEEQKIFMDSHVENSKFLIDEARRKKYPLSIPL